MTSRSSTFHPKCLKLNQHLAFQETVINDPKAGETEKKKKKKDNRKRCRGDQILAVSEEFKINIINMFKKLTKIWRISPKE